MCTIGLVMLLFLCSFELRYCGAQPGGAVGHLAGSFLTSPHNKMVFGCWGVQPCKFLMSHSCLKGDDCPYSHDLRAFPCKFFHTRGLCYDGENCQFSHGVSFHSFAIYFSNVIAKKESKCRIKIRFQGHCGAFHGGIVFNNRFPGWHVLEIL